MEGIISVLGKAYENTLFVYGLILLLVYALLALLSMLAIRYYTRKNTQHQLETLASSPMAPGITILAPAFNEGLTIISNVRSLLTLNYPRYEIIIINDGSTDNTMEQLVEEFKMVAVDFAYNARILTQPVRKIYKSTDPAYSALMVIDKVNGKSKADAVNAGMNVATFDYFVCTDVDCILHKNTLLELILPVMQEEKKRVIAVGATLRIANSSDFDEGVLIRMRPPRQLLPRFQEVEYIRSFVLGKMGWSYINCVPNVSGGLGLFDTEVATRCGGYDHSSFGEDMELLTRMCRYAHDNEISYAVRYIPRTLCWTEGPSTVKIFSRQRTRWARGLAQLMYAHFSMFLNPRYGKMGMIVFPFNFFFELLAPLVEFSGILIYIYLAVTGQVNWPYASMLLLFVYTYAVMITTIAILWDQLSFRYYKKWWEVAYLCLTPFMEFLLYHPLIVFFSLRGYYYFLTGKKSTWGNMQRQGFGKKKK
ncbi:glycosyltransferase family 2 protein [Chitinophaga arvensicola]|uniref:Glycosyltransferase, catalytic subunit of cellulose synthase and poly-beta-1,6-N-acetylglucosamine synthase n=1 Tax=Chitinophaga arvensicola TaxID=29529 RepID=A0A1I0RJS9_9BACT|nr:glycosyltransferase family 2 protein [Chitinophaga arvensicola]SEW41037.1 Glycosyltransferase, catalytic subunit of cellulose synthase and poly-beta-1,6-N-acetylglucosamine synthase [Chitinophaga arvensicola]